LEVLFFNGVFEAVGKFTYRTVIVDHMVGDGDDVESCLTIDVDDFLKLYRAVRVLRVNVKVAEQH
jgi:hypothetical protein